MPVFDSSWTKNPVCNKFVPKSPQFDFTLNIAFNFATFFTPLYLPYKKHHYLSGLRIGFQCAGLQTRRIWQRRDKTERTLRIERNTRNNGGQKIINITLTPRRFGKMLKQKKIQLLHLKIWHLDLIKISFIVEIFEKLKKKQYLFRIWIIM